jgi:hypothetical protein
MILNSQNVESNYVFGKFVKINVAKNQELA